jgi:hypothetical protein
MSTVVNLTLRPLYSPEKRDLIIIWNGVLMGHTESLDVLAKRNIPDPAGNRTPLV